MNTLKKFSLLLLATFVLLACKKETSLEATVDTPDAFARTDNASNPVDHQIFLAYKETNVPILYSDTVNKNPLTILDINYAISGTRTAYKLRYLKNQQHMLAGINFVKNEILPHLTKNVRPYSVLILDSLLLAQYSSVVFKLVDVPMNSFTGTNVLAVGNVSKIAAMSTDSLASYRAFVLAGTLNSKLNGLYTPLLNSFYSVSAAFYNKTTVGTTRKETLGLITAGNESAVSYYSGSQPDDFTRYLRLYLTIGPDAMLLRFKTYPLVISKINFLKQALTTVGYVQ